MKTISVLGSTGSIGTQTLSVAREKGYRVKGLAAHSSIDLLEAQCREFRPEYVAAAKETAAAELKERLRDMDITVLSGAEGVLQIASEKVDIAFNALVGIAGLGPTMAIVASGSTLALANKESLVCAGHLVMERVKEKNCTVLPVDSEHSAIFQSLGAHRHDQIKKLILTASGGPFFGKREDELKHVTAADALKHPNWSMGNKITIDSATMMNKGFEEIEACWLFETRQEQIEVVIHRESILHSAVEFEDNCIIGQLSLPDMRLPIQYAATWPDRGAASWPALDLCKVGQLTFYPPDRTLFPCLALCEEACRKGGSMGAVINGANEVAVELFLKGKIGFTDIYGLVNGAVKHCSFIQNPTLEEVFAADREARSFAYQWGGSILK